MPMSRETAKEQCITDLMAEAERNYRLSRRGIGPQQACPKCDGHGVYSYPTGSTWRDEPGFVHEQAFTVDACDQCWGSGNKDRAWPSHRPFTPDVLEFILTVDGELMCPSCRVLKGSAHASSCGLWRSYGWRAILADGLNRVLGR